MKLLEIFSERKSLERNFQSPSDCFKLADMYVKVTAAKLLVMKAA
jgi:hypothetical protein